MSTRTDGGPASKQAIRYAAGEPGAEDFVNLQRQAALAKTPGAKGMTPSQVAQAASQSGQQSAMPQMGQSPQAIPLDVPSQFPNEPVTNGSPSGPGAGPEALILPKPTDQRQQEVSALVSRYLPDLQAATNIPGVPDSYRKFVNYLSKQAR
jgi:hypothetical protein